MCILILDFNGINNMNDHFSVSNSNSYTPPDLNLDEEIDINTLSSVNDLTSEKATTIVNTTINIQAMNENLLEAVDNSQPLSDNHSVHPENTPAKNSRLSQQFNQAIGLPGEVVVFVEPLGRDEVPQPDSNQPAPQPQPIQPPAQPPQPQVQPQQPVPQAQPAQPAQPVDLNALAAQYSKKRIARQLSEVIKEMQTQGCTGITVKSRVDKDATGLPACKEFTVDKYPDEKCFNVKCNFTINATDANGQPVSISIPRDINTYGLKNSNDAVQAAIKYKRIACKLALMKTDPAGHPADLVGITPQDLADEMDPNNPGTVLKENSIMNSILKLDLLKDEKGFVNSITSFKAGSKSFNVAPSQKWYRVDTTTGQATKETDPNVVQNHLRNPNSNQVIYTEEEWLKRAKIKVQEDPNDQFPLLNRVRSSKTTLLEQLDLLQKQVDAEDKEFEANRKRFVKETTPFMTGQGLRGINFSRKQVLVDSTDLNHFIEGIDQSHKDLQALGTQKNELEQKRRTDLAIVDGIIQDIEGVNNDGMIRKLTDFVDTEPGVPDLDDLGFTDAQKNLIDEVKAKIQADLVNHPGRSIDDPQEWLHELMVMGNEFHTLKDQLTTGYQNVLTDIDTKNTVEQQNKQDYIKHLGNLISLQNLTTERKDYLNRLKAELTSSDAQAYAPYIKQIDEMVEKLDKKIVKQTETIAYARTRLNAIVV